MQAEKSIPKIVDDLYAGTLDDVAWNRALIATADLVSGTCALLFAFSPRTGQLLRNEIHRFDPLAIDEYQREWAATDLRVKLSADLPLGEPIFEAKLMPLRSWKGSEIYNEFLLRADAPWVLAYWLHRTADKVVSLCIEGSRHRGPFDQRDGERIQPVIPHLRRALEIKDRLEFSQVRAETLAKTLDNLSFGVMVLDADGRLLEASAVTQALMRGNSGIRRNPDGTLWLREPAGAELDRWILAGAPPAHNSDGLLHVARPLARPISVMVARLPPMSTSWIGGDPRWMLLLFDPDRHIQTSAELIARDLGITEREAEVAALLVAGYDLRQIAQRLHISLHTARAHLKAIYSKTGHGSQADLIRRVAGGPAVEGLYRPR